MSESAKATKSRPVVNELTKPFWDGAAEHRLVLQHCVACGHFDHPPFPECTKCRSQNIEFVEVSGRGTIHSSVIVRSPVVIGFEDEVPYACVMVELDEQEELFLATNVIGIPADEVVIGDRVIVDFLERDGFTLPVFRLDTEEQA